jgi:hypothetical protein
MSSYDKWEDEVVYKIYCNDNLEKLPEVILIQMRDHLNKVIARKENNSERN